jgi:hypothetical protein
MHIEMPNHSSREDIHCISGEIMTVLSDREINTGDHITSPHKNTPTHFAVYHVEEIKEKRQPMGDWKSTPPNLYKIKFRKEMVKHSK